MDEVSCDLVLIGGELKYNGVVVSQNAFKAFLPGYLFELRVHPCISHSLTVEEPAGE
jgi:hypothetical protein